MNLAQELIGSLDEADLLGQFAVVVQEALGKAGYVVSGVKLTTTGAETKSSGGLVGVSMTMTLPLKISAIYDGKKIEIVGSVFVDTRTDFSSVKSSIKLLTSPVIGTDIAATTTDLVVKNGKYSIK